MPKPPDGVVRLKKKTKSCKSCDEPRSAEGGPAKPPSRPEAAHPSDAAAVSAATRDPTVITVEHWGRLLDGALYASSSRLDWAVLLQRTHGLDALSCPRCDGRLGPIATLNDLEAVRKILTHLGRRAAPLPRARARDPTGQERFDFDAA